MELPKKKHNRQVLRHNRRMPKEEEDVHVHV